ncbi:hypothetical protein ACWEFL_06295 [Streptomyces sp. NPDC004838]
MTQSAHPRESLPLDTTAQLLSRITAELSAQLGRVRLNGTRRQKPLPTSRPAVPPSSPPMP